MKYNEKIETLKVIFESPIEISKRDLALYRTHSGKELAEEIADTSPSLVLDLGCGANIFKKFIPNLIGIDIADVGDVDIVSDINTLPKIFQPGCADWILCLGPLNYGDDDWINSICSVMKYLLKSQGTIVCHTSSLDSRAKYRKSNAFSKIAWTDKTINRFGMIHNFELTQQVIGYTDTLLMTSEHQSVQEKLLSLYDTNIEKESETDLGLINPRHVWRWSIKKEIP